MDSKNYKDLLIRERNSTELTDEEYENTLEYYVSLRIKELEDSKEK
jgi:hypothetical protein